MESQKLELTVTRRTKVLKPIVYLSGVKTTYLGSITEKVKGKKITRPMTQAEIRRAIKLGADVVTLGKKKQQKKGKKAGKR
jgi:hypothetical protein